MPSDEICVDGPTLARRFGVGPVDLNEEEAPHRSPHSVEFRDANDGYLSINPLDS